MPPDTAAADLAWATPRRMPQPVKTFAQPLRLAQPAPHAVPAATSTARATARATCSASSPSAPGTSRGWRYFEMDASHNPHITVPQTLATLLDGIAAGNRS